MIAGAAPIPPIPSAARAGTAAASADSGTISRPNSAIDGIVCSRFSTAKTGPCQCRRRRTAATPSGNPISSAAPTEAATSSTWRISAAANDASRGPVFAGQRQRVEQPGLAP